MSRLLISALPGETRAAWLDDDGGLIDLMVLRADRPRVAGALLLGRVRTVDKALDGAFVDVGLDRAGFLPLPEGPRGLSEGDTLVVRAARDPSENKGARLSACLGDLPAEVAEAARTAAPPALLRAAPDPLMRALDRETLPEEIAVDESETFRRLRARLSNRPEVANRLSLDLDPEPLFERAEVEAEIDALLEPRVALPSGGHLLIEPVRTLTAVDVNAGGHGTGGAKAQALAVDLEAAPEIARQLRLRALAGLIVIDFLELRDQAARKRVTLTLRRALASDPATTRVQAVRASGLVEMTRARLGPALHEILTRPCGIEGSGRERDPVALAFAALRAARAAGLRGKGKPVTIAAAAPVLAALDGPAGPARAAVAERLGRPLRIRAAPEVESFEIVLK